MSDLDERQLDRSDYKRMTSGWNKSRKRHFSHKQHKGTKLIKRK